jgi:hypothetical protein
MNPETCSRGRPGTVVAYAREDGEVGHEHLTRMAIAAKIAAVKGYGFEGEFDPSRRYRGRVYFVPSRTMVGHKAFELGICNEDDLFGGVVPYAFVGTKTITHPLVDARAYGPPGWSTMFAQQVRDVVLDGVSAFTVEDARRGASNLITRAPVRVKLSHEKGGRGQFVVSDLGEVDAVLAEIDGEELAASGLVMEENLTDIETYSVGQVRVGDVLVTYCGIQKLTHNEAGEAVYGGSELIIANGNFDALLSLDLPAHWRTAVTYARKYDGAARVAFTGFFASRRNYDVARGRGHDGRIRWGVLEQSWRIGGASGCEIAAIEAFTANPGLKAVKAASVEVYGENADLPPQDATVYFSGVDPNVGHLTKYVTVDGHVDA